MLPNRTLVLLLGLSGIPSLFAQSALEMKSSLKFLEPLSPCFEYAGPAIQSLVPRNADFWMLIDCHRSDLKAVYFTSEGEPSSYRIHFAIQQRDHQGKPLNQSSSVTHLIADIPTSLAGSIDRAWELALKHTRYQAPEGQDGMVLSMLHGDLYYFGYGHRYFGQNRGLVTGEALLIQNLGFELMKYSMAQLKDRVEILPRIEVKLKELEIEQSRFSVPKS